MQPTRQKMLSAIEHKIARTGGGTGPGETGYYLPVMIGDVLDWMENNQYIAGHWKLRLCDKWKTKREPLDKQSDECISYIFKLLSHV